MNTPSPHSESNIALVGTPNSGKTALFNAMTGSNQKIGNYPGVTVEKKIGQIQPPSEHRISVIDLPGTYSLNASSPDEKITVDILTGENGVEIRPNIIVAVADASNLETNLALILDLLELDLPVIVVLNMIDLAENLGQKIDLVRLKTLLGCSVITTVATKKIGIDRLIDEIKRVNRSAEPELPPNEKNKKKTENSSKKHPSPQISPDNIKKRFDRIEEILGESLISWARPNKTTAGIDKILLHPFFGPFFLCLGLILIFQAVFTWAATPMAWTELAIDYLAQGVSLLVPPGLLQSLLVDGVIAGVGAVIVFLPQILILFFFIFLMEASGYMARAAFLMDRLMASIGLQGRSFVPLLSSFACAIPGIMAARTIKSPRERLLTIMVSPLMTCSARLPVYVLLISAFIPDKEIAGFLNLQGIVMFALFLTGIISAILTAFVMKQTIIKGERTPFILELPAYKTPDILQIMKSVWLRAKIFLRRAGTMIMSVSIILWGLSTFPQPPEDWTEPAINYAIAGRIGHAIEPVVAPLGFDWRIATGMIPGFAAREVMVGALATVFAIEADNEEDQAKSLGQKIQEHWGIPTGLALLVWYIFSPQCLATFAVARRETNGWKWPIVMFSYMLALAYFFAFLTYQLSSLIFT